MPFYPSSKLPLSHSKLNAAIKTSYSSHDIILWPLTAVWHIRRPPIGSKVTLMTL